MQLQDIGGMNYHKKIELMATEHKYIDLGVTPYALPDVCEALCLNGVHHAVLTLEDGNIHVRWEYDANRKYNNRKSSNLDNDTSDILMK